MAKQRENKMHVKNIFLYDPIILRIKHQLLGEKEELSFKKKWKKLLKFF